VQAVSGLPEALVSALADSGRPAYDWSFQPCLHPVTMRRNWLDTTTGEVGSRDFQVRCGTRREEDCEPCSKVWQADAFHALIRGANDGTEKLTFITLTPGGASVFGAVHTASYNGRASERCACRRYHAPESPVIGLPVDPDKFDYAQAASFNNAAPRLATVTMQKVWRQMAAATGPSVKEVRMAMVRVMEWQQRGLLHVHILVRGEVPEEVVRRAVHGSPKSGTRRSITPASHGGHTWGPQVDVQHIEPKDRDHLIAYITKMVTYAVKDVTAHSPEKRSPAASAHRARMEQAGEAAVSCTASCSVCKHGWSTGRDASGRAIFEIASRTNRKCRRHGRAERQFGFTGNVLSLNRSWGTTLGDARRTRQAWGRSQQPPAAALPETVLVTWERIAEHPAQAGCLDVVEELVTHPSEAPPEAAAPEPGRAQGADPCHPDVRVDGVWWLGAPSANPEDDHAGAS
jgi:hypothetical protein